MCLHFCNIIHLANLHTLFLQDSESSSNESQLREHEEGCGRRQGRGRTRGRGRGPGRAQVRGQQRGVRGRRRRGVGQRGRGRRQLVQEEQADENAANHGQRLVVRNISVLLLLILCISLTINIFTFQNLVEAMDLNALRAFALELLRRQPAAFADLVNGELPGPQPQPDPDPDPEANPDVPEWCKCRCCVAMPTQLENKCCTQARLPCITLTPLFPQLVLDGNVLDLAMRYREDFLVLNHVRNNENFRHAAYRQYVLWQYGRLGRGNRRVIPSCCVTAIRRQYPSPNGLYTGYQPARL